MQPADGFGNAEGDMSLAASIAQKFVAQNQGFCDVGVGIGTIVMALASQRGKAKALSMLVTHNMEIALQFGNRLIMMHKGKVVVDIHGEDKKALTVTDLLSAFEQACGEKLDDDKVLLSRIEKA